MSISEIEKEIKEQQKQIDHSVRLLVIDPRWYFPQLANLQYAVSQLNLLVRVLETEVVK